MLSGMLISTDLQTHGRVMVSAMFVCVQSGITVFMCANPQARNRHALLVSCKISDIFV